MARPRSISKNATAVVMPNAAILNFDRDLHEALTRYHDTLRPGMPVSLTLRELLWVGLGTPVDVAIHRSLQVIVYNQLRAFLFDTAKDYAVLVGERIHEASERLATTLPDLNAAADGYTPPRSEG